MRGTLRKNQEITGKVGLGSTTISGFSPHAPHARKEVSPKVGNADNEQFMRSKKIKVNDETMRAFLAEEMQRKKGPKPFHE